MSRIHEALKRAEREKGKPADLEAAAASPLSVAVPSEAPPAPSVVSPVPPAPSSSAATAPPAAPAAHPAPASDTAATTVMTRAAALKPAHPGVPPLIENCRTLRWQGDASKLFFLGARAHAGASAQFRALRSRLYALRQRRALKTLLLTSSTSGEGKTLVCANLAHALARQTERRILLLDCDLRSPSLHAILGAPAQPGLAAFLRGEAALDQILQRGPLENLFFIPAGEPVQNPAQLWSRGLKTLLAELAPLFDWILLDAPAAGAFPEAAGLAAACDGALLVVESGKIAADAAQAVAREIGADRLLGVVLNRAASAAHPARLTS